MEARTTANAPKNVERIARRCGCESERSTCRSWWRCPDRGARFIQRGAGAGASPARICSGRASQRRLIRWVGRLEQRCEGDILVPFLDAEIFDVRNQADDFDRLVFGIPGGGAAYGIRSSEKSFREGLIDDGDQAGGIRVGEIPACDQLHAGGRRKCGPTKF